MNKRLLAAPFVLTAWLSPAFGDTSPPKKGLPAADPNANVEQRPDGSCWQHETPNCPPNAKCNPPAPRQVQCPPKKKPS
jgi:hypothetical protein